MIFSQFSYKTGIINYKFLFNIRGEIMLKADIVYTEITERRSLPYSIVKMRLYTTFL